MVPYNVAYCSIYLMNLDESALDSGTFIYLNVAQKNVL